MLVLLQVNFKCFYLQYIYILNKEKNENCVKQNSVAPRSNSIKTKDKKLKGCESEICFKQEEKEKK